MVKLPRMRGSAHRPAIYAALLRSAGDSGQAATGLADRRSAASCRAQRRRASTWRRTSSERAACGAHPGARGADPARSPGRSRGCSSSSPRCRRCSSSMTEDNEFRFQQLEGGARENRRRQRQLTARRRPIRCRRPRPSQLPQRRSRPRRLLATRHATTCPRRSRRRADGCRPRRFRTIRCSMAGIDQLGTSTKTLDLAAAARSICRSMAAARFRSGDAKAQYDAGYDAIMRGDYAFARGPVPAVRRALSGRSAGGRCDQLARRGADPARRIRRCRAGAGRGLQEARGRQARAGPDAEARRGAGGCRARSMWPAAPSSRWRSAIPNLTPAFTQRLAEEKQQGAMPGLTTPIDPAAIFRAAR